MRPYENYHVRCFKNLPNKMLQECTQCNARRLFILYCYTDLPRNVPYEYSLCIMQMHGFPIYFISNNIEMWYDIQ